MMNVNRNILLIILNARVDLFKKKDKFVFNNPG
jgi:hypothetical protein